MKKIIFAVFCATMAFSNSTAMEIPEKREAIQREKARLIEKINTTVRFTARMIRKGTLGIGSKCVYLSTIDRLFFDFHKLRTGKELSDTDLKKITKETIDDAIDMLAKRIWYVPHENILHYYFSNNK